MYFGGTSRFEDINVTGQLTMNLQNLILLLSLIELLLKLTNLLLHHSLRFHTPLNLILHLLLFPPHSLLQCPLLPNVFFDYFFLLIVLFFKFLDLIDKLLDALYAVIEFVAVLGNFLMGCIVICRYIRILVIIDPFHYLDVAFF